MIKLQDICFAYENRPILKHLSIEINKGEAVLIEGPNGCGKTTLLKVLNGLLYPEVGTYEYMGHRISKKALHEIRFSKWFHKQIGYVFQDASVQLFCNNVEQEIGYGPMQLGLKQDEVTKRVEDMLALFQISELRTRAPYHLSTGEKKKVALASVLAVNPEVLVMDEPFTGLDMEAANNLVELLKNLHEIGKTIIITSHEPWVKERLPLRSIVI